MTDAPTPTERDLREEGMDALVLEAGGLSREQETPMTEPVTGTRHPDERTHDEPTPSGKHFWRCIPIHEARHREREAAAQAEAQLAKYGGIIAIIENAEAQGLTLHVATRATCAEHIEHGDDKPPPAEPDHE